MDYDLEKAGEFALAFLLLNAFPYKPATRAWKSIPWEVMDHLHEQGLISDPKTKAKSLILTEAGERAAKTMFEKHLALNP
jgi:hypothetical protein